MRLSLVRYLQWVFPVMLRAEDGYVIYERLKYRSERDLIVVLYSNFLALPASYYRERGFDKVWALVDSIADEDLLFHALGNEVAAVAWDQGFVSRLDKILIVKENAADEYYWCLSVVNDLALMKFALKYMGNFKDMIYGGSMKSLIQGFHDKKREEFIRRYRVINQERAAILDECKTDSECDKFLKNDKEFMQVLRQRLMDAGKFESIDYLTGADLGK
ncbi:hypothetical protein [Pseudomonas sp. PGPR81]|uniref:hypothetical protein n=1 Tax=Pseudomonas sp. PGPR81 TaxID=2913477 RepID=UPI001EDB38CA|nr:hypothetical protein [Pseudomonas sp. PGPR81]